MNFKKNFKFISLILFSGILLSACTNKYSDQNLDMSQNTPVTPAENNILNISSNPINPNINENMASIKTKDGEIIVKLYSQETPNTVANFINKADSNFYQNLTFHRVIPGFMAQGGDPTGTGSGGGKQKSELNNIPFKRGSVGLARTPASKEISNDSQFFICYTDEGCQHLTGDYVNFGEVISGLDILDKINQGDKIIKVITQTK